MKTISIRINVINWNNAVNVQIIERSNPVKICHIIDNKKLFGVDSLDNFISVTFPLMLCFPLYVLYLL